jgi:hypothetical protein
MRATWARIKNFSALQIHHSELIITTLIDHRHRALDSAMAAEALQSLITYSPASLLDDVDGTTVLASLHDRCARAGLLSSPAEDDPNRLYGLFNVALEHGCGSLVLDYLEQVRNAGDAIKPCIRP